jgi:Arc/MetJ-type ribon-helix-helix transcriptional regulator
MVMETLQIRLPKNMLKGIDETVKKGLYTSRSDFIRDLIRRHYLSQLVGILPDDKNSVKEIRNMRKKLSKEIKSFADIEKINRDKKFQ